MKNPIKKLFNKTRYFNISYSFVSREGKYSIGSITFKGLAIPSIHTIKEIIPRASGTNQINAIISISEIKKIDFISMNTHNDYVKYNKALFNKNINIISAADTI